MGPAALTSRPLLAGRRPNSYYISAGLGRPDNNNNKIDPARAPLAWLAVEKLTLENVAECRTEKAVEPSDRIELLHVDKTVRHAG